MYHIFFIHSSVDGHLGCFHVLAIVNSAAMNIRVHASFQIIVFSGYMARRHGRPSLTPIPVWEAKDTTFLHLETSTLTDVAVLERGLGRESEWVRAGSPSVHTYFVIRKFKITMWSSLSFPFRKRSFLCHIEEIFCLSPVYKDTLFLFFVFPKVLKLCFFTFRSF